MKLGVKASGARLHIDKLSKYEECESRMWKAVHKEVKQFLRVYRTKSGTRVCDGTIMYAGVQP